jgi:hypothetical protein
VLDFLGHHADAKAHREAWRRDHQNLDYILFPTLNGRWLGLKDSLFDGPVNRALAVLLENPLPRFAGTRLLDVAGLLYTHDERARVEEMQVRLAAGRVVRGPAHLIVAAGVTATARRRGEPSTILDAVRRSVVGVGTHERRADVRPEDARRGAEALGVREILVDSLCEPAAYEEAVGVAMAFGPPVARSRGVSRRSGRGRGAGTAL